MKHRVTLKTAITITKYAISPISCWPLSSDASTADVVRHNVIWWVAFTHLVVCIGISIHCMYQNRQDPDLVIRLSTETVAMSSTLGKMLICKKEGLRLQSLFADLQMFLDQATNEQSELIQSSVDKRLGFHSIYFVLSIFGPLAYIAGPAVTSQPLPGEVVYPFSIEPFWIWVTMYISQSVITMQVGCMVLVDFMFAILLWYIGARFEMLSIELERATDVDDVTRCIQKHQELIKYVARLQATTGIMALEVTAITMFSVSTGGFVLIRNPPLYVAAKFVCFELVAMWELFVYTWPANNLIVMSERIKVAAFDCAWIGNSPKMLKNLLIIMQRSRDPLVISVDGFLPALSLELYGSAMSMSFSYLTTLRAIAAT